MSSGFVPTSPHGTAVVPRATGASCRSATGQDVGPRRRDDDFAVLRRGGRVQAAVRVVGGDVAGEVMADARGAHAAFGDTEVRQQTDNCLRPLLAQLDLAR